MAVTAPLLDAELGALRRHPDRVEPPQRRPTVRVKIYYPWKTDEAEGLKALGRKLYVDAGIDHATGRVCEIFARGGSAVGEDIDSGLDKVANALSVLLQLGEPLSKLAEEAPRRLAHHLADVDRPEKLQRAARVAIAAILHTAIQIEAALGAGEL